jgi:formylglycine-generating enzyme
MGGTTNMGHKAYPYELPQHSVYVSAFYMDKYEVTKGLWDEVALWATNHGYTFYNAGSGKAANHPVQSVSWYDVLKWCNARSQKENLTPCYYTDTNLTVVYKTGRVELYVNWSADGYRLPTEAEWEKAARGGASGHRFPWSDSDTIQHARANYESSTNYAYDTSSTRGYHPTFATDGEPYTSPVGYFAPNGYGLYDMAGNVWELCWDYFSSTYYSNSPTNDPRGPSSFITGPVPPHSISSAGSNRVVRGGSWGSNARDCRAAMRLYDFFPPGWNNNLGFRCARAAGQ